MSLIFLQVVRWLDAVGSPPSIVRSEDVRPADAV
jgi:hypothetical protein